MLDKAATEYTSADNPTMLLDCDYLLEQMRFHEYSKIWENSEIKSYLNGTFLTEKFNGPEQAAITASKKDNPSENDGWGDNSHPWVPLVSNNTSKTYIFLLDMREAENTYYGYTNSTAANASRNKKRIGTNSTDYWWLRTAYVGPHDSASVRFVSTDGRIDDDLVTGSCWLSPAFNIDLSSVIFSSCVVGTPGQPGAEYKLTIKDDKLGITPGDIVRDGTTITVPYEITGDNKNEATQVSVLIMDSAYSAGTATTSGYTYTKLSVNSWNISGTGTFTLPDKYAAKTCGTDYHAYILAEDVIAGNSTDYASTPVEIIIPDINVPVSGVTISPKETELKPGASKTLNHTIAPNNATNKNVTWSTSKPSVATVDNDGKVTAVDEGEAIITVRTVDGDFTDTCRVIVRKDAPVIKECTITFDPNGGTGDMDPQKADKGETVQLKANEFTRSRYSFTKWNTEPDGSGKDYDDKASVKLEDNMTLYAQWKENEPDTYSVTVKTDGKGEATASPKSGKTGDKINLSADADKDWRFVKWKVVSGDIRLEDPEDEDTSFVIGDSDIVVKAVFEKEEHKHDDDDDDEDDDDDDDSHEESHSSSSSQPSWTPEKASETIAKENAANQQQAAAQMTSAVTKLTALASLTPSQKASYAKTGLDLVMTRVSIIDANTAKLLVANNKIPYNVKIMFGQSEVTITIPANFNFKPFIKADGTMNIHEVLWSIISGKTNKR